MPTKDEVWNVLMYDMFLLRSWIIFSKITAVHNVGMLFDTLESFTKQNIRAQLLSRDFRDKLATDSVLIGV